jgi:hypothetical protein
LLKIYIFCSVADPKILVYFDPYPTFQRVLDPDPTFRKAWIRAQDTTVNNYRYRYYSSIPKILIISSWLLKHLF